MEDGSMPVMPPEAALQVLTLKHPKGRRVTPHLHVPHRRETDILQECLVVIRGKLRITFFDEEDGSAFAHIDLSSGETCVTLSGPHGVEFLEDSEVIEVKNGPFIDDKKPFSSRI
jgi:hypothetical protein